MSNKLVVIGGSGNTESNYWINTIILNNRKERNNFLGSTNENGIITHSAWELMNRLVMYKDCQTENIATAELLSDRLVNIPSSVI